MCEAVVEVIVEASTKHKPKKSKFHQPTLISNLQMLNSIRKNSPRKLLPPGLLLNRTNSQLMVRPRKPRMVLLAVASIRKAQHRLRTTKPLHSLTTFQASAVIEKKVHAVKPVAESGAAKR